MINNSRTVKRILCIFPLLLLPLLLTSCLDYVQAITYSDGEYHYYYKATLMRELFTFSGEDPDEIAYDMAPDTRASFPENAVETYVDNDLEVGAEYTFSISPYTRNSFDKSFLPTTTGKKCFFPFILGKNMEDEYSALDPDDPENSVLMLMLSSAKCRIMISKKVLPEIERAYFEGKKKGADIDIPLYDYGDDWCAEIPMLTLLSGDKVKLDRLVVIRK